MYHAKQHWYQLVKSEDLQIYSALHDCNLNIALIIRQFDNITLGARKIFKKEHT